MKLSFRQGILRHQSDANGNPTFLQRSGDGTFVSLIISPEPTVLCFAQGNGTYIVEELKTVQNAWGPITGPQAKYLFWDLDRLTAKLTRGITFFPPIYNAGAPPTPGVNQHWFDTMENKFKVWNGTRWQERLRLFAGQVTSGAIIRPEGIKSQAGLVGSFDAGHVLLDSFGNPLRQSDGTFVTTSTWLNVTNLGTVTARVEGSLMTGVAAEEMAMHSLIQLRAGRKMVLGRSTDYRSRVAGIIVEDLIEGDVTQIISTGVIKSFAFAFAPEQINRPFFCGPTGQVTLVPPTQGVSQICGLVYDTDAIFLNIEDVTILDNPEDTVQPAPPAPVNAPVAGFTISTPTVGIAPFTLSFTSTSVGAIVYEWDFTNDGFVDAVGTTASYTYAAPGIYTVRHRALNSFGQDDQIQINAVTVLAANTGPLQVNLGISFIAPQQVQAGATFTFQVRTENDGMNNATNVVRQIRLRTNNSTQVVVSNPPLGSTVSFDGPFTVVNLAAVNIGSSAFVIQTLEITATASAKVIQVIATATSPEVDPELGDNSANLTIRAR